MKYRRIGLLVLILVIVVSAFQVINIQAQEDSKTYFPLFINRRAPSSFGMQILNFDNLKWADEADSYWLRYNRLKWSEYQNNSKWNFKENPALEANMIAATQAGAEMILIVSSTPLWAQKFTVENGFDQNYYCGPMKEENIQDFANFMNKVVSKYSYPPYNVTYYELWNEQDQSTEVITNPDFILGCWGDLNDEYFGGGYYAEMLKKVYPAVKAANPNAQILIGGLLLDCDPRSIGEGYCYTEEAALKSRFFEGILQAGGGDYFDFVNFHGFTYYDPQYLSPIQMERTIRRWPVWAANGGAVEGKLSYLREMMADYNVNKPILLTEATFLDYFDYGYQIDPNVIEYAKAEYVVWLFTRNMARRIYGTTWYHLDYMTLPQWSGGGLLDANQQPTDAYRAFKFMTSILKDAIYRQDLSLGSGILGFEFVTRSNRVRVLFSEDGLPKSIEVPEGFVQAYDLFGNPMDPSNGTLNFTRPTYIELVP